MSIRLDGRLLLSFDGFTLPSGVADRFRERPPAGAILYPALNVRDPAQVRDLTDAIRHAAGEGALICADQEGGQLLALGPGSTPFPGNMALGAVDDVDLTQRVGRAIGTEVRAMGLDVVFAPVCDLASDPAAAAIGARSFGSDPSAVAALAAALVRGIQSAGAAATAKHFPGHGDATGDPHLGLPVGTRTVADGADPDLAPFIAAIDAGVRIVMSTHVAVPAYGDPPTVPATLSRRIMRTILRERLGFDGVLVTDALDMGAIAGGTALGIDLAAALGAGVDLLLCGPDPDARARTEEALEHIAARDLVTADARAATEARLDPLRAWLASSPRPTLDDVRSRSHLALADEVARRSITLVRDEDRLLPLRLGPDVRVVVIEPIPEDLTPADLSQSLAPGRLAGALRERVPRLTSIVVPGSPSPTDIAAAVDTADGADLVIVGTMAASLRPAQGALVRALLGLGGPTVTVAMRTPWDLATYPEARTHLCTYAIVEPSLRALAGALFGDAPISGRLPVAIDGIAPLGHASAVVG